MILEDGSVDEPEHLSPIRQIELELARRELCRRKLLPFIETFNPGYIADWVHVEICEKLEQFVKDVIAKKSPRLMIEIQPRVGKQCADSTEVLTLDGWKTHGELQVGDFVFHPSGKPVEVLAVSEKTPSDYVVSFAYGQEVRCHGNHEWVLHKKGPNTLVTVSTKELFESKLHNEYTRADGKQKSSAKFTFDPAEPAQFPDVELPVDPYVFGVWLGDGSTGKPVISMSLEDKPVADAVKKAGYPVSASWVHQDTGVVTTSFAGTLNNAGKLTLGLQATGAYLDKHIPEIYLRASFDQRLQLLAGLIDSDGCTCPKTGRIAFSTVKDRLRDNVFDLLTTLGLRPYQHTDDAKLSTSGIQGRQDVHIIGFQPMYEVPCILERKRPTRILTKRRRRSVQNVRFEPNGEQGHCIQVDSPDGLYCITRSMVPTHNSELVSRGLPPWFLGQYPDLEVIASSYNLALALRFSRRARQIAKDPMFKNIFGVALDKDAASAENWLTEKGGGYLASGVGTGISGSGFSLGIIDDPLKDRQDAESPVVRAALKDWYTSTFYTRRAPGAGIIVTNTRWHDDDLSGWLRREMLGGGDQWDILHYPAIALEDEKHRKKGEVVNPLRYPLEEMMRTKRVVGTRDWQSLYMQNPVAAEGEVFKKQWFRYYRPTELPPKSELTFYQAWDLAIGEKAANDYTVGVTVGFDQQGRLFVVDLVRKKMNAYAIVEAMLDAFETWKPEQVGIEQGQIEMAIGPHLMTRMAKRNLYEFPKLELKTRGRSKEVRASAIQGRMEALEVFFPEEAEWLQDFINELLRFPAGLNDDQVDALSWIGIMAKDFTARLIEQQDNTPKWLKRAMNFGKQNSSGAGAMSA